MVHSSIQNPVSQSHPPWAGHLTWGAVQVGYENCTASLVAKQPHPYSSWVLTAAHCFHSFAPNGKMGSVFGASFYATDVRFHPGAYGGIEELSDLDPNVPPGLPSAGADLALVRIRLPPGSTKTAIKLWHPYSDADATAWLTGQTISFAGLVITGVDNLGQPIFGPATGQANPSHLAGNDLISTPNPSHGQPGDSGGGAWVELDGNAPPGHWSFPSACAVTPGASSGETVLVGVNREVDDAPVARERMMAVYRPDFAQWIAKVTEADEDDDGTCDTEDVCPGVADDQANSNELAEDAWGGGIHLGDACDPAPVPVPELEQTNFVGELTLPGYQGNYYVTKTFGRAIHDDLTAVPVIGGPATTSEATPRFCDCRDANLKPIADPAFCANPTRPHHCFLNPTQAEQAFTETSASQASLATFTTA